MSIDDAAQENYKANSHTCQEGPTGVHFTSSRQIRTTKSKQKFLRNLLKTSPGQLCTISTRSFEMANS